jgi:hypothetical protein
MRRSTHGLWTVPGDTQLIRMPLPISSAAIALVSESTAPFDAEYTARSTRPTDAATEQVLTIAPRPATRMLGSTARLMLATPKTLTANTRSQSSGVDVTTSPTELTPALLQSTSIRPWVATISATRSWHAPTSVTSKPSRRSRPTTSSPDRANALTTAAPIPPAAPVTTTTRPLTFGRLLTIRPPFVRSPIRSTNIPARRVPPGTS